ncbi:replication protein P [Achromobacter anxifer]|uniref:replication protein P n=1 Tax=Achromobacter anxifer TaxID=1287737 RepID=UPI0023F6935C|nr:replication protein P [Achromobacter anxifer]MDF8360179.1 replication protein P [Achromobacter anxifer]
MTTVTQSTPERSGWAVPLAKLEGISLIDHLWNRLSGTYGGRWLKDFPDIQSIENWKEAWAEALDEDRVTPQEVAEGLRTCRRMFPDWPPAVGEFIRACRPGLIPENAFHDAVAGMNARRRGEVGQWSHPAVYWAAVRVGSHDLLNCGYSVMQARWERALSEELSRVEWAAVPTPAVALPAPGTTYATPEEAAKALEAMGAGAILDQSDRDPLRGWKRVIAETENPKGKRYSPGIVAMARNALRLGADQGAQA